MEDVLESIRALLADSVIGPVVRFFLAVPPGDRPVLYILLLTCAVLGYARGRRRGVRSRPRVFSGTWRLPLFQNRGEALVARTLLSHFGPPDHHLMNHVTLRADDGTTQVDHILVSRFGVFVIETKDHGGWIFANAADARWTQVLFRQKFRFQNPIHQNHKHVCAVRALLDFVPPDAVKSIVVFSGSAEFKTDMPLGVTTLDHLPRYIAEHATPVMSRNRQQFCVGRLETARLAISRRTDVEHVEHLARRFGAWE